MKKVSPFRFTFLFDGVALIILATVIVVACVCYAVDLCDSPEWNQFKQDCPCGAKLSGPYEGNEYKFVCSSCQREYAYAWSGYSDDVPPEIMEGKKE